MRRRGKTLEVSTFPFLAVLLCAMGSLILVLLVMDRKAKLAARYKAMAVQTQAADELAKADAARRDLTQQREREARAAWEQKRDALHATFAGQHQAVQGQLKNVGDQLAAAAARLKAELDESGALKRRVETERVRLAGEEKALTTVRQEVSQAVAQSTAERAAQAKMTADLVQLENALTDLKEARERDRQTYSVVPYRGKHGESRRPLYVECTGKGVVFHPDRAEVAVGSDPTAARVEVERRIKRQQEYLASIQAKLDDKPYLMLLVRPDGINSYYALQKAVSGIDLEFGYEFVDGAWVFDFTKDPDGTPAAAPVATAPNRATPSAPGVRGSPLVALVPPDAANAPRGHPDDGLNASRPGYPTPAGIGASGNGANGPGTAGTPDAIAAANLVTRPGTGIGGPTLGTPDSPAVGPAGPGNPPIASAVVGPRGLPPNPPPSGRFGAEGTTGSSAANPIGVVPPVVPIAPPTGIAGPVGTKPAVKLDPPYHAGKAKTEFATQGERHGPPPNGEPLTPAAGTTAKPGPTGGAGAQGPSGDSAPPEPAGSAPAPGTPAFGNRPPGNGDRTPRLAPTQPVPAKKPPPLRVARLNGDRDYLIFIECRADDVMLFPSQKAFSVQQLQRGDEALFQAVKQMIDKKQSLVRPGDLPFRPQVRFLVHPESIRSYHTAYPILNALGVPQTRQNLEADDDVTAIVVGP